MHFSSAPPGSGLKRRPPRLLLVDDDVLILRTLVRLLRHARPQWETITALNAADALAALKLDPIDVLVTDLVMPGMSGIELVELVRSTYPNVACIIHSTRAHGVPPEVLAHATAVLQKPADIDSLIATLEGAMAPPRDDDRMG